MTGRSGRSRGVRGLRLRLYWAMVLVIVAGAGTLLVISLMLGPAIFARHLAAAGLLMDPLITRHVQEGFAIAMLAATGLGVAAALVVATGGALLVARRIARPITETAGVTARLAAGDYSARADPTGMGPEMSQLTESVNALARRLQAAEATRVRLIGDIAHELRTPLAALDATVEAIADGVLPADARTLASVSAQSDRLSQLVDDLALVSRAEERAFVISPSDVDLFEIARDSVATAQAGYQQAQIALSLAGAPGVFVRADRNRAREALDQLLDNARAACAPGDSVTVTVMPAPRPAVRVSDTGRGFAEGEAEHLFERFYRGDPARGGRGTGIGLTIARALISAQGGTLTANSPGAGRGATFTLTLPSAWAH